MSSVGAAYMYAHEQKERSARSSVSTTPRDSSEAPRPAAHKSSSSFKSAAMKIVQAAKEHHRSVNSAFDAVYGTKFYAQDAKKPVQA